MARYIKNSGSWSPVKSIFIKDGGIWKTVKTVFIKDNGAWKKSFTTLYTNAVLITSTQSWTVPAGAIKVKFHLIGGGGGGRCDNGAGGTAYYGANGTDSTIVLSGSTIMTGGRGGGGGQDGTKTGTYGGGGSVQGGVAGTASGGNISNTNGSVGACTLNTTTYTSYDAGTINGNAAYNSTYLRNNYGYGGATCGCGGTGGSNYAGGSAGVAVSEFYIAAGTVFTINIGAGGSNYSYAGTAYNGGGGACIIEYA